MQQRTTMASTGGPAAGRSGRWALFGLGAWSVVSWAGRVRNIFGDDELSGGERAAWLVPAVVFVIGGLVTLVAWWRARRSGGLEPGRRGLRPVVVAFALWTLGYWALRMVLLVGNGHSAGFVAVHAVLAVVAGVLAVAVLRQLLGRSSPASRGGIAGMTTAGTAR